MTCPVCNGCGEVVTFFIAHNAKGEEITHQQAIPCPGCGGKGEVDD